MSATDSLSLPVTETGSQQGKNKIIFTTGLALFAMFFGAGSTVFPLELGAHAESNVGIITLGFLIGGVGIPFLGLFATSLYQGNYWEFFNRLGKLPAFMIITFLMAIIGPLFAMPRTEALAHDTWLYCLPAPLQNNYSFSAIYCTLIFILAYKETKVIDILGLVLSPAKIISFVTLIIGGILITTTTAIPASNTVSTAVAFKHSLATGYGTMDLLATFFFCSVAFNAIQFSVKHQKIDADPSKMIVKACVIGASLIGAIYLGFLFVAYQNSSILTNTPTSQMITVISNAVLGTWGQIFICICVTFACIATALALAEVCSSYLYRQIFHERIPKNACLFFVVALTYAMSNLGFDGIMKLANPILQVLYPALVTLCVMNILYKWKGIKMVKLPVLLTIAASLII